ncbi:MAG: hypothetical protein RLZZ501_600, partial [Pseudomonadota bacterium]
MGRILAAIGQSDHPQIPQPFVAGAASGGEMVEIRREVGPAGLGETA